jgi:hypothetical protein
MAQKDPTVPARRLEEGERVVVHLRRKRLENVLMAVLYAAMGLVLAATLLDWDRDTRLASLALFALLAVPVGIIVNTHHWLTDRRVLRSVVGVWTSFPLDGAVPRVTKGTLRDDVRFEDAAGAPVLIVKSVDNAAEVLTAHAGLAAPAPTPAADEPSPS